MSSIKLIAKTFSGLEGLLAKEIRDLGGRNVEEGRRAVEFEGELETLYKIVYQSRLALTILRPIWRFQAKDEHTAYRKAYACDWSRYMDIDQTFAISSTVSSKYHTHSRYISLKLKDAICDRFRKMKGRRPNVDPADPDIRFNLYVQQDQFIVSLDAAGDPLFKRGYRREGHRAPLNEVLAAGIIAHTGWTGQQPLYDGMCGTGTLLLEGAMQACKMPAQIMRRHFAFQKWSNYDRKLWGQVVKEANERVEQRPGLCFGSDTLISAVRTTQRSASFLDLSETISAQRQSFFDLEPERPGVLVMNPPYGERMGEEIEALYQQIGDRLKSHWKGSQAWLFTGNMDAIKSVGLRSSKKIPLYNGPIECRLVQYDMY
jgi:putative N6-adenine-specific DNA methylase